MDDDDLSKPNIEKIKLQAQDNKLRLKEQRELHEAIQSYNRNIHNVSMKIDKLTKEYQSLITTTDQLQQALIVDTARKNALSDQVVDCRNELDKLQESSLNGVTSVFEKRTKIIESIHNVSDKCDIWALLLKPTIEIKSNVIPKQKCEQMLQDDTKLKVVTDRRNEAIALRNVLLMEPEVGEEFIRTRNALQYSMEIMANEQKC